MLAWYNDIKDLTEKTGIERDAFVRKHARSISGGSVTARSMSSDGGMEEDEADQVPYSAAASQVEHPVQDQAPERPQPGGRFPSDLNVQRNLQNPLSHSSGTSSNGHEATAAAGELVGSSVPYGQSGHVVREGEHGPLDNAGSGGRTAALNTIGRPMPNFQHEQPAQVSNPTPHQQERAQTIDQATTAVAALAALAEPASQALQRKPEPSRTETTQLHNQSALTEQRAAAPSAAPISVPIQSPQPILPMSTKILTHQGDGPTEFRSVPPPVPMQHETANPPATLAIPIASSHAIQESRVSGAATPATTATGMTDSPPVSPEPVLTKAPFARSQNSVQTISDLHIPGEYPRQAR